MFSETKEGTTRILVPALPTKSIFYNPKMELCRDIDIAGVAAFISSLPSQQAPLTYIDALAGTGVRGIRVANEVGLPVAINDRSKPAYELIKRNIELNEIVERAKAYNENANVLLLQNNYDLVEKGAKKADDRMKRLGFIAHCFSCGNRFVLSCSDMLEMSVKATKIVATCINELDIPFYYEHHVICKALKVPPPPISSLIDALHLSGFSASRTHFSDTALKTNARIDDILNLNLKSRKL